MAFHLEIITISPQVLVFGAHAMRLQVVRNDIKSICIWHRWKWKNLTRKHNKQCSCGALLKDEIFALFLLLCILMTAVRALEMLNFTPLNGKPIRIIYSHCDLEYTRAELETFLLSFHTE
ncbi:hypothetical protein Vadar_015217 [Vaccinium darrowii]|uniref:Uncharacterized protein n=1 Tax=Vaccinium darrowii TaxID=229202 RepID=A0ACB7ZJ54_9ERIC|nr:hypothetical protein Vadar_015217 [Vaccinium darrowii]